MSAPRTVWVTGAANGMGASHARRFAELGDNVACLDVEEASLDELVEDIRRSGGNAEAVRVDITDWDAMSEAAARITCAFGPAEVVVANAGVVSTGDPVEDLDPLEWRRVVEVNLTGSFLTAKAAVPQLREAGSGSLIMVSSVCGLSASAGFGAYNASKHGVIGLMRTLAHELGPLGVTVNAVCPGWVRTRMLDVSVDEAGAEEGNLEAFTDMNLIKRLIEPEEVSEAVVWLASRGARMVTGTVLPVDAGLMENRAWPAADA